MDKKIEKPSNVKFISVDSSVKGMKEFIVTFEQNGRQLKDFIFVEEKKGYSNNDYLNEAKEEFTKHSQKGICPVKATSAPFKVIGLCCGVAALTFAGLFTWKVLSQFRTITWDLGNGTLVKEKYKLGETPVYKGEKPNKSNDTDKVKRVEYHYTFKGWQEKITSVSSDITYHADYYKDPLFLLCQITIPKPLFDKGERTYTFDHINEEEKEEWNVDWGDSDITADQHNLSHEYTSPGTKYIKIYGPCSSLKIVPDDPEAWAYTGKVLDRVSLPYGWKFPEDISEFQMFDSVDLITLDLPASLTKIEKLALEEAIDPTECDYLDIPNSVKALGKYALTGFSIHSNFILPDSITTFEEYALYDFSAKYIVFPKSITNYPSKSLYFSNGNFCTADFTAYDVPPTITEDTFHIEDDTSIVSVYSILVRKDTYSAFLNSWKEFIPETHLVHLLHIVD